MTHESLEHDPIDLVNPTTPPSYQLHSDHSSMSGASFTRSPSGWNTFLLLFQSGPFTETFSDHFHSINWTLLYSHMALRWCLYCSTFLSGSQLVVAWSISFYSRLLKAKNHVVYIPSERHPADTQHKPIHCLNALLLGPPYSKIHKRQDSS